MQSETNLDEDILDRFFYLLTKRDDFPPQLLERLKGIRNDESLTSSTVILSALKEGTTQDG